MVALPAPQWANSREFFCWYTEEKRPQVALDFQVHRKRWIQNKLINTCKSLGCFRSFTCIIEVILSIRIMGSKNWEVKKKKKRGHYPRWRLHMKGQVSSLCVCTFKRLCIPVETFQGLWTKAVSNTLIYTVVRPMPVVLCHVSPIILEVIFDVPLLTT